MTGSDVFAEVLADLAEVAAPQLARVTAPIKLAVGGRTGTGAATVTAALRCAGWSVCTDMQGADLAVWVLCETAKPEDREALHELRAGGTPALPVLNKADLLGPAAPAPGPVLGTRPQPVAALLAVAALDDGVLTDADLAALRQLCHTPADLSGPDAFLAAPHPMPPGQRHRLLELLDVVGIASSVVALRRAAGTDLAQLRTLLRGRSGIDDVCARLAAAAAPVRYRRMCVARTELAALALIDAAVAAWLAADRTVLAQMTLAVAVVADAGLTVDPADDAAAHLRRAVRFRDYAAGPVNALHRSCGSDIERGSLRLWARQARCG